MVRRTRQGLWLAVSAVWCLGIIGLTSLGQAPQDKQEQRIKQQNTQIATEEVVHRIGTMLRVMDYYQPDQAGQRKSLERIAVTLMALSREQMEDVLRRLDKAAAEPDADKSAKEMEAAHTRHVEIMQTLRALLAEYETVNTLDQIADKLDKLARTELELALQSSKLIQDDKNPLPSFGGFGGKKGGQGALSPQQLRSQNMRQSRCRANQLAKGFEQPSQEDCRFAAPVAAGAKGCPGQA